MAVPLPTLPLTELLMVTVEPASAVPSNCGVVSLVMLSVLEPPESLAAFRSGIEGAFTPVSIVTVRLPEVPVLPAASVELADIRCTVPAVEPFKALAVME